MVADGQGGVAQGGGLVFGGLDEVARGVDPVVEGVGAVLGGVGGALDGDFQGAEGLLGSVGGLLGVLEDGLGQGVGPAEGFEVGAAGVLGGLLGPFGGAGPFVVEGDDGGDGDGGDADPADRPHGGDSGGGGPHPVHGDAEQAGVGDGGLGSRGHVADPVDRAAEHVAEVEGFLHLVVGACEGDVFVEGGVGLFDQADGVGPRQRAGQAGFDHVFAQSDVGGGDVEEDDLEQFRHGQEGSEYGEAAGGDHEDPAEGVVADVGQEVLKSGQGANEEFDGGEEWSAERGGQVGQRVLPPGDGFGERLVEGLQAVVEEPGVAGGVGRVLEGLVDEVDVEAEPLEQLDVAGVLEPKVLDDGPAFDGVGDVVEGCEQVVEERGRVGAPQVLRLRGGHAQDGGELVEALAGFGDGVVDGSEDALEGAARPLLLDPKGCHGGGVGEDGVLADTGAGCGGGDRVGHGEDFVLGGHGLGSELGDLRGEVHVPLGGVVCFDTGVVDHFEESAERFGGGVDGRAGDGGESGDGVGEIAEFVGADAHLGAE